jgi:hypothetical protein
VICTAHYTLIFRAMANREHVAGLVDGDFKGPVQKKF